MKTESIKNNSNAEKTNKCCDNKNKNSNPFIRFFKWWVLFTGLYSAAAVCPFCGNIGCPVGFGSAGAFGAFCALFTQNWKNAFRYVWGRLKKMNKFKLKE